MGTQKHTDIVMWERNMLGKWLINVLKKINLRKLVEDQRHKIKEARKEHTKKINLLNWFLEVRPRNIRRWNMSEIYILNVFLGINV